MNERLKTIFKYRIVLIVTHLLSGWIQCYFAYIMIGNGEVMDRITMSPGITMMAVLIPGFIFNMFITRYVLKSCPQVYKTEVMDDWNLPGMAVIYLVLPWFQFHAAVVNLIRTLFQLPTIIKVFTTEVKSESI